HKDLFVCEYSGKPRHTKEHCWKLHGRPTRGRGGKRSGFTKPQAHVTEIGELSGESSSSGIFSNTEIQSLKRLLSQLESSSTQGATSNFVNSGNVSLTLLAKLVKPTWVIDSEANKHTTGSSNHFLTYSKYHGKEKIRIVDGSFVPITSTGSIN